MTTSVRRQKLMTYITYAEDNMVEALYTLLENEINEKNGNNFSDEQILILEKEHELYLKGERKSHTLEKSHQLVQSQREFNKPLSENILDKKYVIISIIGSHAGEEISYIFSWKINEVQQNKKTYWLVKSHKAQTKQIQEFCKQAEKENENIYCLFITPSTKNGSRPATSDTLVKEISENNIDWVSLSDNTKIKGKIDLQSTALVISELEVLQIPEKINLEDYSEVDIKQNIIPIQFRLGASTSCCKKVPSIGMKSSLRTVVAWGKLDSPYAVWVR